MFFRYKTKFISDIEQKNRKLLVNIAVAPFVGVWIEIVLMRDAENDVALGISRVQKSLIFDVLSISPNQKYADEEFGTYEYDKKSIEKGKEVPVKLSDHCMDAIRYAVMGAWDKIKYWLPRDPGEEKQNIEYI